MARLACRQPWQGPPSHSVLMMTSSAGFGQTSSNSGSLPQGDIDLGLEQQQHHQQGEASAIRNGAT